MPRKTQFEFDDEKQRRLVECLLSARSKSKEDADCKYGLKYYTALLFKRFYPECRLNKSTLYNKAIGFQGNIKVDNLDLLISIADTTGNFTATDDSASDIGSLIDSESSLIEIPIDKPGNSQLLSNNNLISTEVSASPLSSDGTTSIKGTSRAKFVWDNYKREQLIACYDAAKGSSQGVAKNLYMEFKKLYPECTVHSKTMYNKALQFKKEQEKQHSSLTVPTTDTDDRIGLTDGNDSVFEECATPISANESQNETAFVWDKNKEVQLLQCLKTVKSDKNDKRRLEIRLYEEFLKLHPDYPFKATTLHKGALDLESGKRKSLRTEKSKMSTWYAEKEIYLIKCATEAHEENKTNIALGIYEGRGGPKSHFEKILVDKFRKIHPDINANTLLNKYYILKKKYKLEFEAPTPELSDTSFSRIMSYWQHGYVISTRNLFEGCCHVCSSMIVYRGSKRTIPVTVNPERIPILDHYSEDYLNEMFKKSATQYYRCNVCKGKNLLDLYPLAPPGTMSLPIPEELQNLNGPEKHQIALVGIFSTTEKVKNPTYGVYEHRRGEVNACHKTDQRYFEMYAMIVERSEIEPPRQHEKIVAALLKLREINTLYQRFYAHYETLYRYYKPEPNAPRTIQVFDKKVIQPLNEKATNDMLLEDEPAGLLIPESDLEARGAAPMSETVAGAQHLKDFELARRTYVKFLWVTYTDPYLAQKIFPWLHPYGTGGWEPRTELSMGLYYRWRISMVDDRFRSEPNYYFYFLDVLLKNRIQYYNSVRVKTGDLKEPLKKKDFDVTNIYESKYGTEVPSTIPNSRTYWFGKLNELFALSAKMGRTPDFFVTLTQNDNWPEVQAVFQNGMRASADIDGKENIRLDFRVKDAINHPYVMVEAFYRRLQEYRDKVLHSDNGPFGKVADYWCRTEYQQRGGLHVHMVLWCEEGTVPEDAITAEMPRFDHPHNEKWREYVRKFQLHSCRPRCYMIGKRKTAKKCKYGFPFVLCDRDQLDEHEIRHLYTRRHAEDMQVVPHNLALLLFWGAHVNVQRVTDNGWEMYLAKYVAKAATTVKITVETRKSEGAPPRQPRAPPSDAERYLTTRMVSSLECCALLLQKHHSESSREMIYLPIEIEPPSRFVKRPRHMRDADPNSEDIYYQTKLEKYLDRPDELVDLTYPEFYAKYYYGYGAPRSAHAENNLFDEAAPDQDELPEEKNEPKEPPLVDKKGRRLRRRTGKEAVPYFRHIVPYGDNIELYSLKKLLENVPVDADTVHLLLSRTGSYFQECLDRNLIDREDEAMHFLEASVKRGYTTEQLLKLANKLIEGNWLENQDVNKLLETVAPYHLAIEQAMAREIVDEDDETVGLLNVRPRLPLHQYAEKFSESQRKAYEYITSRLADGRTVKAFVNGEAGTGKSFLIDALTAYCKENGRTVQKLATTGSAAYQIGGVTIHAFFKLDVHLTTYLEMGTHDAFFLKNVDVIMIDEASMLEAQLLKRMDRLLRSFTEREHLPYGGKSLIMFGDVAQLPAITCNIWCDELYARQFDTLVLRQNMRAADDRFQQLLKRVRVDKMTVEDRALLYGRKVSSIEQLTDVDTINGAFLVSLRKTKAQYDQDRLDQLEGDEMTYLADDVDPSGNRVSEAMSRFIEYVERVSNLLPKKLKIKQGAKVMLLRNKNFRHGWVNGRMATVLCATQDYVVLQAIDNPNFRIVLERTKQEITWPGRKQNHATSYYRIQFPIELAYAITVHKAQGHTLDKVIVRARQFFCTGQFYTAISRAKKLEDLYFTELDFAAVKFAKELGDLLEWFDRVDVLREDFDGVKPPMPRVPRNWSVYRTTRSGGKRLLRPEEQLEGLFGSSDEDEAEPPKLPSPRSAVVVPKSKTARTKKPTVLVRPAPIKTMPRKDEKAFKRPLPVREDPDEILEAAFVAVKTIPVRLDREAYTAEFRRRMRNIDLASFTADMRNAGATITLNDSLTPITAAQKGVLYDNMSSQCTMLRTRGAGHCLYNMTAINLYGNERKHLQIRAATLLVFIENWQYFEDNAFVLFFDTVQQLIRDTCRYTEEGDVGWGGNAHLKALAVASGRDVYVYRTLTQHDRQQFGDVPAQEIQTAIDEGTTQHTRYAPFERIDDGRAPIMGHLSDVHFSAIVKNTPRSTVFVPNARADAVLNEDHVVLPPRVVNETPIDLTGNDRDGGAVKKSASTDSLVELFDSQITIGEKATGAPSIDRLADRFKTLSSTEITPSKKRSAEKSPATPRRKAKTDVQSPKASKTSKKLAAPTKATPPSEPSKKRSASPVPSPRPTRSRRKLFETPSPASSCSETVEVPSQVRRVSERDVKSLLEKIKKIPVRTNLQAYVKRVLELTEPTEIGSFAEAARNMQPATLRRSMTAHAAAEKLLYKALTNRARIVRTQGTGSCLFSACSIVMFGTPDLHLQLRAALCHVFSTNADYFQQHRVNFGAYQNVQKLIYATSSATADDNVAWASRALLKAVATLANRHVYVYLPLVKKDLTKTDADEKSLQSAVYDGDTKHVRYQPIGCTGPDRAPLLLFLTANHFSAMVPIGVVADDAFAAAKPKIMY